MNFVFINHTTLLPVDIEAFDFFNNKTDEEFKNSFGNPPRNLDRYMCISPIHFVNEKDYKPKEDTDALGTYTPIDPDWRRPVIKVCPEKIFTKVKFLLKDSTDSLIKDRFHLLIAAVTIHEAAHFLMDLSGKESNYPRVRLDWASKNKSDEVSFNDLCPERLGLYNTSLDAKMNWVEESLANAIMLKCFKEKIEGDFLKSFVQRQSDGYKASLNWNGTLEQTLATAKSFAILKQLIYTRNINKQKFNKTAENKIYECKSNLKSKCSEFDFRLDLQTQEAFR
jgi:hypothetical protein